MRYHTKPIEVEARLYTGDNATELHEWLGRMKREGTAIHIYSKDDHGAYRVVYPGDWVVRDADGNLRPIKPDIFALTYEPQP